MSMPGIAEEHTKENKINACIVTCITNEASTELDSSFINLGRPSLSLVLHAEVWGWSYFNELFDSL